MQLAPEVQLKPETARAPGWRSGLRILLDLEVKDAWRLLAKRIPATRTELYLIAIGLLASLPLLLFGFPHWTHDGFCHLRWWQNFSSQFWKGEFYPRWLLEVNGGMGSATFFYYPPLPYWVSGLLAPVAGQSLPAWRALGWASALGLVLSGLTALACFRKLVGEPAAFVAAVLYMLMPYHLAVDLLERGAYAEYWSFVWMPLIIGGILGIQDGERHGSLKTAIAFAGLFLTHLPTTVTFVPVALGYALLLGVRVFARTVGALVGGCGLAALYLIPALTTLAAVSTQYLQFPYEKTFFFPSLELGVPLFRPDAFNVRLLLVFLDLAQALGLFYLLNLLQEREARLLRHRVAWLLLGCGVLLMMLPVSVYLYQLFSPLRMIQFAWRFLAPGSFIVAMLVALFWPGPRDKVSAWLLDGLVLGVLGASILAMTCGARTARLVWGLTCALDWRRRLSVLRTRMSRSTDLPSRTWRRRGSFWATRAPRWWQAWRWSRCWNGGRVGSVSRWNCRRTLRLFCANSIIPAGPPEPPRASIYQ